MAQQSSPPGKAIETLVWRLLRTGGLVAAIIVTGTLGFHYFSGDRWLNCLYMAVTTLTTVGYAEIVPLDDAGRVFTMVYLLLGFSVFTYSAFQLGQWVVNAELQGMLERRRMEKKIDEMHDHYIVCGMGRMGWTICSQLQDHGKPFVAIDRNEERLRTFAVSPAGNWPYIAGDATDEDVLRRAGIERARGLATVLATDADNVYVILTARMISLRIEIIARASDEKAVAKLARAGANRVVSPFSTGAMKMARFLINPNVEDFLEIADRRGQGLELADIQITAGSAYVGKKLSETDLRELGVMVIGIRKSNGEKLMPPPGNAVIEIGDCLFAFGNTSAVNKMIGGSTREW